MAVGKEVRSALIMEGCTARVATVIALEGFTTLKSFIENRTERDMLRIPNLGRRSVDQIKELAAKNGWRLGFGVGVPYPENVIVARPPAHERSIDRQRKFRWKMFDKMREVYLRHVDEMPHHFQLHFMHAAQIVGCHHPSTTIRAWWREFYLMIVNDAHLEPETDAAMNLRLSNNSDEWKKREWSPAK